MTLSLETPISAFPKLGIAKLSITMAAKLAMGIRDAGLSITAEDANVGNLLSLLPMRYEDRSNLATIGELTDGAEAALELVVVNSAAVKVGRNRDPRKPPLFVFEITAGDPAREFRPVIVKWFISGRSATNIADYYAGRFKRGTRFVAYGMWEYDSRGIFALRNAKPDELEILPGSTDETPGPLIANEVAAAAQTTSETARESDKETAEANELDPDLTTVHTARCVPIYRKLGPFQTKRLREIIHSVLRDLLSESVVDPLPNAIREKYDLRDRLTALREIHFPPDDADIAQYEEFKSPAQSRLIFDEFFWLTFSMIFVRGVRQREPKGSVIEIDDNIRDRSVRLAPFTLTNAQNRVIEEIFDDISSDHAMNRLIQGDVGSGKTIVAFIAMMAAMENGYQTALMAPTEILAEQHFRNAVKLFATTGHRVALLIGSTKAAEKRRIYSGLENGEIDLVIGTHALIQESVKFQKLGLAVIDEQHRFGVLQRSQLRELGSEPDVLVMTATPIPRSLAMTVYGDLDVSVIDELPPGRTPIKTVVCGEDQRNGVYKGIRREVSLGRQAYIVYPLIEESEKMDLKAAKAMYEELQESVFPDLSIGLLHGKMKPAEKEAVMADFIAGITNILVSTTVIEVGVDVPNASLMVIEHAERFGLSQLHQLRGRVGRGAEQSYCVLLADYKRTAVAKERLGIMEETSDGFKIAERDLEIRGQGEILGTRQSGIKEFRIANIVRDRDILEKARHEAELWLTKYRHSDETALMIEHIRNDKNVGLFRIG